MSYQVGPKRGVAKINYGAVIFLLAMAVAAAITVVISFLVKASGLAKIFGLTMFFFSSWFVVIEILKWPSGKRKIDNDKGFTGFIFTDIGWSSSWRDQYLTYRESIFSVKRSKRNLDGMVRFSFFIILP